MIDVSPLTHCLHQDKGSGIGAVGRRVFGQRRSRDHPVSLWQLQNCKHSKHLITGNDGKWSVLTYININTHGLCTHSTHCSADCLSSRMSDYVTECFADWLIDWLIVFLQVCSESLRFEKLMEHFKNEDDNIDFLVQQLCKSVQPSF